MSMWLTWLADPVLHLVQAAGFTAVYLFFKNLIGSLSGQDKLLDVSPATSTFTLFVCICMLHARRRQPALFTQVVRRPAVHGAVQSAA